jgi:acetolactate synthase small subunit
MQEKYVLIIKAEDRPGLLHIVTGVLNRKLVPIVSLTAAPTDIHAVALITMEIGISEKALSPLIFKLKNIIEVFAVEVIKPDKAVTQRSAYFSVDKQLLASPQASAISKYGGQIVNLHPNSVLIAKSGSEAAIHLLYNALEGPFLFGFSQTASITDSKLISHEDIERISGSRRTTLPLAA